MNDTKKWVNAILHGDSTEVLKELPEASIDCIVTSPPYYLQRDYSTSVQIGNENTIEQYIENLRKVFAQCYRILKTSGTFWLNLGDKYNNGELLGMPWRVALSLKGDGWILRSDIIWHKSNAMPSSVKNRPTTDHEYVFLFVKDKDYYYDADAIREPHITFSPKSRMKGGVIILVRKTVHQKKVKMRETQTCMMEDGIKRSIPKEGIEGQFGKYLFPSFEMSISLYFQRN